MYVGDVALLAVVQRAITLVTSRSESPGLLERSAQLVLMVDRN